MKTNLYILLALTTALMLTACGGRKGTRVTEGNQEIGTAPTGTLFTTKDASIVHVEHSDRLATMRNGNKFEAGAFLVVKNRENGQQTGILKALPKRLAGLRTADILEGEPDINDIVKLAPPSEAARLGKIYRDAEQ